MHWCLVSLPYHILDFSPIMSGLPPHDIVQMKVKAHAQRGKRTEQHKLPHRQAN